MKKILLLVIIMFATQSCSKLTKWIDGSDFDKYLIEADNNSTEQDKESINYYNYVVGLCDTLYFYSQKGDTANMAKCIKEMYHSRFEAELHDNPQLRNKMLNNYDAMNLQLDKLGVPREVKRLMNPEDYIFGTGYIKAETFKASNLGVDAKGNLYTYIRRDDQEETKAKICNNKIVWENAKHSKLILYSSDGKVFSKYDKKHINKTNKDRKISLNDFFNDYDTDYSATELTNDEEQSLKEAGIYYDEKDECWRQKNL